MSLLLLVPILHAAPAVTLHDAEVLIPWKDFEELYRKGLAPEHKPEPAPRAYTLDRATYTGHIVGEGDDAYALLHLSLRGQVHNPDTWTTIPLLSTSASLQSARVDGKDGAIFLDGGYYQLVTHKAGPFTAELDIALSLFHGEGETGFAMPLAPAGATEIGFTVEGPDLLDFDIGSSAAHDVTNSARAHSVRAWVTGLGSLSVAWHRAMAAEVAQEGRVYAETQLLVGVGEGVLQGRALVNYTILHEPIKALRVQLPRDVTVLEVEGPGIRDWKQDANGVVSVALNFEAAGAYRLTMDYERAVAAGPTDLPVPRVLDVTREKTWIGLDARSAVEVVAGPATNATPVDVRELPPAILGQTDHPVLLGWKARGGDLGIPVEVRTHPDVDMLVTLIDSAFADTLVTPDGRRMTHVRYAVRNNRNQFLRLQLPTSAEVWSASVAGRAVKVARGDDGILVPLVRSGATGGALSAFLVELVYVEGGTALGDGGTLRVEIPRVDAPTSQLQWTVYLPDGTRVGRAGYQGSVPHVTSFSTSPVLPPDAGVSANDMEAVQRSAGRQDLAGTLGQGVEPVEVTLPLAGPNVAFEKVLVLDEPLWVSFEYRVRRPR